VKIVLREDVDNLGDRGQVVSVKPGYARNFLFPKGLALEATAGNMRSIEMQRRVWAVREAKEAEDARKVAAALEGTKVTVTKRAGENAALYGSVTNAEIADLLAAKGFEVDRRRIQLREPIKTLGTFKVPVRIHRQVVAEVDVEVVAEAVVE
jgi:large subunit ribosomal protein L9